MRINKYLSSCELGSRRKVEEYIVGGKITVNDQVMTNLAYDVNDDDIVKYNGKKISPQEKKVYIMLNKPKCYITSIKDEKDRHVVMDLLKGEKERVFPVGRLDFNTQGLLLLTNDGEYANNIIHPSKHIYKTYEITTKVMLTNKELAGIRKGMIVDNVKYMPAEIYLIDSDGEHYFYEMTITEGKNREIRNIFASINVKVYALKRLSIGGLELGDLKEGKYVYLTDKQKDKVFGR